MRKRIGPLALLVVGVAAGWVQAQQPTSKPKDKDGPEFDAPRRADADAKGRKVPGSASTPKTAATPQEALDQVLVGISLWPGESGEDSLRALVARGPEMQEPLRQLLKSGSVLERSAAARGLCLLGDRESYDEVKNLFADPRQRGRFAPILQSLHDLDPERTLAQALVFLDSDQGPLRAAATTLLKHNATPEIVGSLRERMVATKSDALRVELFLVLEQLNDRGLSALALERYLGDPGSALASRVTQFLSERDDPETRAELTRLALKSRDRRGLFACLALALAEQREHSALLPDELFEPFAAELKTSDQLLRATACVVCGMIGLRSDGHAEVTQAKVLPALSDVVLNGRYFGDFELCFKSAVGTLELVTGEHFGESVPAWRQYFQQLSGGALKGRRDLQAFLLEDDAESAVVEMTRADATGTFVPRVRLVGPELRASGARADDAAAVNTPWNAAVILDSAAMRSVLAALEQHGFLDAQLARALPSAQPGFLALTVTVRGRHRGVMGPADDSILAALISVVERAAEPELWQLLLPEGEGFARISAEERAWFSTHPDPMERRSRLVDLALEQIRQADGAPAQRAFDLLAGLDQLGSAVRATQIDGIAALLKNLPANDGRARRLLDLLLATKRPDVLTAVVDALAPRGMGGLPWLADAVAALLPLPTALTDERPLVRLAALEVAKRGERPADLLLLKLATSDREASVREKALALLSESASPLAAETLERLAREGEGRVRCQALRLLGKVKTDAALDLLTTSANGSDGSLVAAALEGLARRGDQVAAAALDGFVRQRDVTDALCRLGLSALKSLPRALAVERLQRLVAEGNDGLAREATYGLADLGEISAAPLLLADLEEPARHRRAQTLLTYLFCKDYGTEPWRFRSLAESQPGRSHAQFFLDALIEAGAAVPPDAALEDRLMLPVLLTAVEDERWFVRRSALEFLEAVAGRTLGVLAVNASHEEIADMARRWREATSTQARSSEQH